METAQASAQSLPTVFICYAHQNNQDPDYRKQWLDLLLDHLAPLKMAGQIQIWCDQQIEVGEISDETIRAALVSTRVAILLLSPAFYASRQIRDRELPRLLAQQAAGQTTLIPIVLSPCRLNETGFEYEDATGKLRQRSLGEFRGVNSLEQPLMGMTEPEQDAVLKSVADRVAAIVTGTRIEGALDWGMPVGERLAGIRVPNNLPNVRTLHFVGRDAELATVHERLQDTATVAISAIAGMGGIGKTELATQYALRHLELGDYPGGICWLRGREDIGLQIVGFARSHLDLDVPQDRELDEQVAWCWQHWQPKTTLIVLDDVQKFEEVQRFLPPVRSHFKVLLTSRSRFEEDPIQVLVLDKLQPLVAFRLLYEILQGDARLEKEQLAAEELCDWLGYLPLGVKLVATFLKVEPDLSVSAMLTQLKTETLKHDGLTKIETVFELSWEKLTTPDQQLTALLSLFAAAPIPWKLVYDLAQGCRVQPIEQGWMHRVLSFGRRAAEPEQWCMLLEPKQLERSRRQLVKLSLLTRAGEEQYELHPLLREFFAGKRTLRGAELAQLAEDEAMKRSFCAVMVAIARQIPSTVTLEIIAQFTSAIPHLKEAATTLNPWLSDADLIEPSNRIARFYAGQSAFGEAEEWKLQCRAIATERLGDDHPAVATSLNNLAGLYDSQGRYGEAEPLYVRSLEIRERQLGADHPAVATSLNNLAYLYDSQGRYGEAEPLYVRSLGIKEKVLGINHPSTQTTMQNLELLRQEVRSSSSDPA